MYDLTQANEKYKGDWAVRDGKLYKGEKLLHDDYSVVDEITKQTKAYATIFLKDTRIATSVLKEDGSRAVGTKVSEAVAAVVLKEGKEYVGEAVILGKKYLTLYTPIKDSSGAVIGIWFVGSEKQTLDEQIRNLEFVIGAVSLFVLLAGILFLGMFVNGLVGRVHKILTALRAVASGDLRVHVAAKGRDEIGDIADNVNTMTGNVAGLLREIMNLSLTVSASSQAMTASTQEVSKVSEQVAVAIEEVAKGATEQALSTESGNAGIQEVVKGLQRISEEMAESETLAVKALDGVTNGEQLVQYQKEKMSENKQVSRNVAEAIQELSNKSQEIGGILDVIKGIADQTNMLALNAAIEAARAGEQGRGFAVVAEEVRKLAEQSGASVKRIGEIIREVREGVLQSAAEMEKMEIVVAEQSDALCNTVLAFDEISSMVSNITENIRNVTHSTQTLSRNAKQAGDAIANIASVAQETAAGTEEVSASTEEQNSIVQQIADSAGELAVLANRLQDDLRKFSV